MSAGSPNPRPTDADPSRFEEPEDEEPLSPEEERETKMWWLQLPDFIKADYPLDLPPARLRFAQDAFNQVGVPLRCPEAACRRAQRCQGGDGPPCLRADRDNLLQVLCLWWFCVFENFSRDEMQAALKRTQNPYALPEPLPSNAPGPAGAPAPKRPRTRRRR